MPRGVIASGHVQSESMPSAKNDLVGKVFGRLTVLERVGQDRWKNTIWRCRCTCGAQVDLIRGSLVSGNTQSCGCWQVEQKAQAKTHGCSGSPEYRIWQAAKARCFNPKDKKFKHYGGRGIVMCRQWSDSFSCFLKDMGTRPSGFTLERKDNNLGYAPGNCIWASYTAQNNNLRRNRVLVFRGCRRTLTQWSRFLGVSYDALRNRIRRGWQLERALCSK